MILILALLAFVVSLFGLKKVVKFYRKVASVPTAPGQSWILGHLIPIAKIMIKHSCTPPEAGAIFMRDLQVKTAPKLVSNGIYKLWFGAIPLFVVSSPEVISIMYKRPHLGKQRIGYGIVRKVITGLVNLNGSEYQYHKKLLLPYFLGEGMTTYCEENFSKVTADLTPVDGLEGVMENKDFLVTSMKFIEGTLWDAAGITHDEDYYSHKNMKERWEDFCFMEDFFANMLLRPLVWFNFTMPFSQKGREFTKIINKWNKIFDVRMKQARENYDNLPTNSLIKILTDEMDRNPKYFTKELAQGAMLTMTSAGIEITANTIAWILHHVGNSQETQDKIFEEMDSHFEGRDLDSPITSSDLKELTYLNAVMKEGVRTFASPMTLRDADADIIISKSELGIPIDPCVPSNNEPYIIPKGCPIALALEAVNNNTRHWEDPYKFIPERHLQDKIHSKASVSFAGGPRICIGHNMAKTQMMMALAMIFRKYRVQSMKPVEAVRTETYVTLHIIDTVDLRFIPRR
jgi:cytochrome P450